MSPEVMKLTFLKKGTVTMYIPKNKLDYQKLDTLKWEIDRKIVTLENEFNLNNDQSFDKLKCMREIRQLREDKAFINNYNYDYS